VWGADQKVVNFEQILFANGRMLYLIEAPAQRARAFNSTFLTGTPPGVRFPRSEVERKESLMQKGESLTRASRCKLGASKTGGRQQTNCAPKIHSATYRERGRHDGLDVSLLESVINGDEAALRVLFTRHGVRIYRFVLRLTGNRSIAEEIVSDVFLEVWRHAARFGMKSQVSTWLLAIARNKALAILRRRSDSQLCNVDFPLQSKIQLTIQSSC
jgi:hypothetical protein